MEKLTSRLTDNMEGFILEPLDFSKYETSFRRWLVQEIESKRMTWQEARTRFNLPHRFDSYYYNWQKQYSDEIAVSLSLMTEKERTDFEALEARVKELEKELEKSQMKIVAVNTMIDIAEQDYKLQIRKKSGPKQ